MPRTCPLTFLLPMSILTACATRPSEVETEPVLVVVKSVRLPDRDWLPWYTRVAEHCWVDLRDGVQWHRVEWNSGSLRVGEIHDALATSDERWERRVAVHTVYRGEAAAALVPAILARAPDFPHANGYRAWPGPNSNTFVEWLAQEVPGFAVDLPQNAIGKDFAWLHAGTTSTRTGVELETLVVGAQLGLHEGVEAHVLGLTVGVGLWPPRLKLPVLPAFPDGWFAF